MTRRARSLGVVWAVRTVAPILLMASGCGSGSSGSAPSPTATVPPPSATPVAPTAVPTASPTATAQPNIVFLLADDLDAQFNSIGFMPKLKDWITDHGTSFANAFVNVSLCCPSRSTILRGQYAHNTEVLTNRPPTGGFQTFHDLGRENSTIATWLQAAGYKTALFGKYLNGYPDNASPTFIPPGWDAWASPADGSPYSELNYTLNENGTLVAYGEEASDYLTDVIAAKSVAFIHQAAGTPFFLYIPVYAPHKPANPAPRHEGLFSNQAIPRPPSFNEEDVSDKPAWVQSLSLLDSNDIGDIRTLYRKRLRSMQAVDDLIEAVGNALRDTGQLERTYFVFLSDNGFHLGEHRQKMGKQAPYEEEIHVPFIVRGPGVPAAHTIDQLVGNVDIAPTFAEWAGVIPPEFVDGRSLCPLLQDGPPVAAWRAAFLIQHGPQDSEETEGNALLEPADDPSPRTAVSGGIPPFRGLRTAQQTYVEYDTGERELYDLASDPYQLSNRAASADASELAQLSAWLDQYSKCAGESCRQADTMTRTRESRGQWAVR